MAMQPHRPSAAPWIAAALVAGGCAGPSLSRAVTVTAGQRTAVRLVQFADHQSFALQNASSGAAADVYSDAHADRRTKVVADAQLQALLDVFAEQGLFARSEATVPPDARDALVVQQGERRWIFTRRRAGAAADELPFHEAKSYFLSLYNSATAYHTGAGRPDLKAESNRAQQDAAAARRRLEELRRQGR